MSHRDQTAQDHRRATARIQRAGNHTKKVLFATPAVTLSSFDDHDLFSPLSHQEASLHVTEVIQQNHLANSKKVAEDSFPSGPLSLEHRPMQHPESLPAQNSSSSKNDSVEPFQSDTNVTPAKTRAQSIFIPRPSPLNRTYTAPPPALLTRQTYPAIASINFYHNLPRLDTREAEQQSMPLKMDKKVVTEFLSRTNTADHTLPSSITDVTDVFSTAVEIAAANYLSHNSIPDWRPASLTSIPNTEAEPPEVIAARLSINRSVVLDQPEIILRGQKFVRASVFDFGGTWESSDDEDSEGSADSLDPGENHESNESERTGKSASYWEGLMKRRTTQRLQEKEQLARGLSPSRTFYLAK